MERSNALQVESSFCNAKKCIKEILYYSDTELLDLVEILLLILVNPFIYTTNPSIPLLWGLTSIISGFILFFGTLYNKPNIKQWGYKLGVLFLAAVTIECVVQKCWYIHVLVFITQLIVMLYLLWRNANQHK